MPCPSTRGRIGRCHELQQRLKDLALPQTWFAKTVQREAERAMEMTASPVRRMFSASSDSERYYTCYRSDSTGIEPDFHGDGSNTAPNTELAHDAQQDSLSRRAATTKVPRHTDFGATGAAPMGEAGDVEEVRRMYGDGTGDTVMDGREEHGAPGKPPGDSRDLEGDHRHPREDTKVTACGKVGSKDHCHCRPVSLKVIPGGARMPLFKGSTAWTTPPLEFLRTRQSSTTT